MKTTLFFYTGTGNSLWVARQLSKELGETDLVPMVQCDVDELHVQSESIGLVFPVHIWGVPSPVINFVKRLVADKSKYLFALAVNAGQVARTLIQLKELMADNSLDLSSGYEICMPSNYIPWGGPGPKEKQEQRFAQAAEKIKGLAPIIRNQESRPVEKGKWWHNIIFTWFYRMSTPYVPKMDGRFQVDERCNACRLCEQICPARNIRLVSGKPVWLHHCQQCLACIQWCPQACIQYGSKTARYDRYHHPEIRGKDMRVIPPNHPPNTG